MMNAKFYSTVAFLSNCHYRPTLEFSEPLPTDYKRLTVTDCIADKQVKPDGIDENGAPYFSAEFYQKLWKEYDEISKFDHERARKLFWFNVRFEL